MIGRRGSCWDLKIKDIVIYNDPLSEAIFLGMTSPLIPAALLLAQQPFNPTLHVSLGPLQNDPFIRGVAIDTH